MSDVQVRPFRRSDREQVTALVNVHAAAVVPGVSASVNTVLSQLEREPGEYIVDPWVIERTTVVAEQRARVVAAAHLLRYGTGDEVGESFRNVGEIRWLLFWPKAADGRDTPAAADTLAAACIDQFTTWGVTRQYADGSLLVPAVAGVPEQWPHIRQTYERAGFVHEGHTEFVWLADVADLPRVTEPPLPGMKQLRSVGILGTRLAAMLGEELVGYIELDTNLGEAGRLVRGGIRADVANLHVVEKYRRRGVATWLFARAADWLRLAGIDRLLDYGRPDQDDCLELLPTVGFRELTRTERGWVRRG